MITDIASIVINRHVKTVFKFMSDPNNMDLWSFGTWRIKVDNKGLVHGQSIFDGSTAFVRIQPNERNYLIDYWVGSDSKRLVPRIFVRITSGEVMGSAKQNCVLSMVAFRSEDMNGDRWHRLVTAHAFEVQLIKSLLENDFDHRKILSGDNTVEP